VNFQAFLAVTLSLYVVSNYLLLPRLKRQWKAGRTVAKVGKAGLVAGVEFLRDTSAIATAASMVLAAYAWTLDLAYGENARVLGFVVGLADEAHEGLDKYGEIIEHWTLWVLLAGGAYLGWRRYRRAILARFAQRLHRESQRANQEKRSDPGKWRAAPPTPEMIELRKQITQCYDQAKELEAPALQNYIRRRRRQELLRQAKHLEEQLANIDFQRRLDLREDPAPSQPQSRWGKVGMLFISKGFTSDLKGAATLLSRAATACLAIALVGVSTPQLSESVRERVIHLDQLRVLAEAKEVDKTWQEGVPEAKSDSPSNTNPTPNPNPPPNLPPEDYRAVQQLTNDLGRALARNPAWGRPAAGSSEADRFELRRQSTILEIQHRVDLPDHPATPQTGSPNDLASLAPTDREIFDGMHSPSKAGEAFAQKYSRDVVSWFGESWGKVKSDIAQHAADYTKPLTFDTVRDGLVDQIVGSIYSKVAPKENELGKLTVDGLQEASKDAVSEAVDIELKKAMIDLKKGEPFKKITERLSTERIALPRSESEKVAQAIQSDLQSIPTEHDLAEKLKQVPPPDTYHEPGGEPDAARVDSAAREVVNVATGQADRGAAEEAVDALADFDYYFPPTVQGDARSSFTRFLNTFPEASEVASVASSSSFKVERAFDFSLMSGFSRVGGVLIGRNPDPGSPLDFQGLRWEKSGRSVTLHLIPRHGKEEDFGPFDQSLVHQALAYAADGRILTVTMVDAKPLEELKILLNPVLVDTPLGCRITNLDRWVDTYYRDGGNQENPADRGAERRVQSESDLYYLAWGARYLPLALKIEEALRADTEDPKSKGEANWFEHRMNEIGSKIKSRQITESAAIVLAEPAALADKTKSLLAAKPDYYDTRLVSWIEECSASKPPPERFISCIADHAQAGLEEMNKDELRQWLAEPPTFQIWSGVRERPYTVAGDLSFLRPQRAPVSERLLWPFDFLLQVSFTSAPAFAEGGGNPGEYTDKQPWEFPELHSNINKRIEEAVEHSDPPLSAQLEEMRDFVLLQRLFRVALAGGFGSGFQVEDLAGLTSATAGGIPFCHTPRWNPRPGQLEMEPLVEIDEVEHNLRRSSFLPNAGTGGWLPDAVSDLKRCEAVTGPPDKYIKEGPGEQIIGLSLNPDLASVPAQEWEQACRFDRIERLALPSCRPGDRSLACQMVALSERSKYIAAARKLRESLRVDKEGASNRVCPSLSGDKLAEARRGL